MLRTLRTSQIQSLGCCEPPSAETIFLILTVVVLSPDWTPAIASEAHSYNMLTVVYVFFLS